jgi:hypothetical protein
VSDVPDVREFGQCLRQMMDQRGLSYREAEKRSRTMSTKVVYRVRRSKGQLREVGSPPTSGWRPSCRYAMSRSASSASGRRF